ncbi:MAG: glycosyltransferase family 9 protein [Pedosphaera sp.]|nr:glycosyltransferase family 9 protein [Pedosphaera sp.]
MGRDSLGALWFTPRARACASHAALADDVPANSNSTRRFDSRVRLLFVKLKHIGDALLLTPTLAATKAAYPHAEIWVVVRRGTEGILAGCPQIDQLLTASAPEADKREPFAWLNDLRLLRRLRQQNFDFAFEFTQGDRGRLLAGLSGASVRCASDGVYRVPAFWRPWFHRLSKHDWSGSHQVEASFRLVDEWLPLGVAKPPPLVFHPSRAEPCDFGLSLSDFAVLHPGTRWQRKRWPAERWIEVGRALLTTRRHVVISVGPGEEEVWLGDELAAALGPQAVCTRGKLSWAQLAGLLGRARLFIGVDTAAMHLAAACQCPTVALFGASVAQHWRPWAVTHRLVGDVVEPGQTVAFESMEKISVAQVLAAVAELGNAPTVAR